MREIKKLIKAELSKVFDVKILSFLIGAGCSSFKNGGQELGVPVMSNLAKRF